MPKYSFQNVPDPMTMSQACHDIPEVRYSWETMEQNRLEYQKNMEYPPPPGRGNTRFALQQYIEMV